VKLEKKLTAKNYEKNEQQKKKNKCQETGTERG